MLPFGFLVLWLCIAFGEAAGKVTLGTGDFRLCGDHSDSNWMKYDEYAEYQEFALHIDIDTSMCGFTETDVPQYVANLMDSETDKDHKAVNPYLGRIAGSSSILRSSPTRFRVVIWDPTKTTIELVNMARNGNWKVSWIGAVGTNTGQTNGGKTGWKHGPVVRSIYTDVDTSGANFKSTPNYFTALHGFPSFQGVAHWRTVGANVVYNPTSTSFRVYVVLLDSGNKADGYVLEDSEIANKAEDYEWTVGFIGDSTLRSGSTGGDWDAVDYQTKNGGSTSKPGSMHISVDASNSHFQRQPTYVVSMNVAAGADWRVGGNAIIGTTTPGSLQMYLGEVLFLGKVFKENQVLDVGYAKQHWKVNYIGFQPRQSVELVRFNARIRDVNELSFSDSKRTQLRNGVAAVLHLVPGDVFLLPAKQGSDSQDGLTVPMEVKVGSKEEAAAVMNLVESDFFGSKLESAMKLNGRGSYVVEGEEISLSKFRTQIIPLLHPSQSPYTFISVLGAIAVMVGFVMHGQKMDRQMQQTTPEERHRDDVSFQKSQEELDQLSADQA